MRRKIFNLFNKMPYSLKTSMSTFARCVPPKFILGPYFQKYYSDIKSSEFYSSDKIETIQLNLLKNILFQAGGTTEFYSKLFKRLGIRNSDILNSPKEVLFKLPFVNKSTIRDEYSQFLSTKKSVISCDYTSTGGTSGEPFYFHINSDRSAKEWAFFVDMWGRVGFNLYSKRASFRGLKIHSNIGYDDDWITRERRFSSFNLTNEYLNEIWNGLESYKPDYIYAYPSTAISLCQFLENSNKTLPESIKAFLIGSENIYDGQAEYIEQVSKKRVFKWYGHSEKLILGGECEKSNIYHAYPQYGYIEFINADGLPAKLGEFAEIVGTGFINTVVPFIRYRTGDYCTYLGDKCSICRRNYPIFKDVRGRWTQEVLYGKKGNSICMSAINVHSDNFKNVFRYQFYQDRIGYATLKIMPTSGFTEKEKKLIVEEFNLKFNGAVRIDAMVVKDIPLTARGKYIFIDQHCEVK